MQAFRPFHDKTLKLNVLDTPQLIELPWKDGREVAIRLYNEGEDIVFVAFGESTVVANLTTSYPIPGGLVEVISITGRNGTARFMSYVKASGTGTVWASVGKGL